MKTLKIEVYGRVQGVNFRNNVKGFCDERGIKGNVGNRGDGSVLIIAQEENEKLRDLVDWLKSAPGFARIEGVKVAEVGEKTKYRNFEIVREDNFLRIKKRPWEIC